MPLRVSNNGFYRRTLELANGKTYKLHRMIEDDLENAEKVYIQNLIKILQVFL